MVKNKKRSFFLKGFYDVLPPIKLQNYFDFSIKIEKKLPNLKIFTLKNRKNI